MKFEMIAIGKMGEVITGNTPPRKTPEYLGNYIPFIKPTDIEIDKRYTLNPEEYYSELGYDKYKKSLIPKGATCVVTIGSIGKKITQAYSDCFINQAMNAVISYDSFDKDYVFYLLKNNLNRVKSIDSGTSSGRENVSKSSFSSIEVLATLNKDLQLKIASILSAYDDLIENNLKRIRLLDEAINAVYKLLVTSEKTEKIKLEDVVCVIKGRKPKNVLEVEEDNCVMYLLLDTVERTKSIYTSDLTMPMANVEDVLMCMDGARSGITFRGMRGAVGSTMAIWRATDDRISGEYLYQFLKENESSITQGNTGAAIPHANRKFILEISIPVLKKAELKNFSDSVNPKINLIRNLYNQNIKLREARDILLPRLMSGEMEVI